MGEPAISLISHQIVPMLRNLESNKRKHVHRLKVEPYWPVQLCLYTLNRKELCLENECICQLWKITFLTLCFKCLFSLCLKKKKKDSLEGSLVQLPWFLYKFCLYLGVLLEKTTCEQVLWINSIWWWFSVLLSTVQIFIFFPIANGKNVGSEFPGCWIKMLMVIVNCQRDSCAVSLLQNSSETNCTYRLTHPLQSPKTLQPSRAGTERCGSGPLRSFALLQAIEWAAAALGRPGCRVLIYVLVHL